MKNLTLVLVLLLGLSATGSKNYVAAKKITLRVEYEFKNFDPANDRLNKTEVYLDGNLCGTSTIRKESEENVVICTTTKGDHHIRVVNYANKGGDDFEEHTIANKYKNDFRYESNVDLKKKKSKIKLVFDGNEGTKRTK